MSEDKKTQPAGKQCWRGVAPGEKLLYRGQPATAPFYKVFYQCNIELQKSLNGLRKSLPLSQSQVTSQL